jgi:hypothetical protein
MVPTVAPPPTTPAPVTVEPSAPVVEPTPAPVTTMPIDTSGAYTVSVFSIIAGGIAAVALL